MARPIPFDAPVTIASGFDMGLIYVLNHSVAGTVSSPYGYDSPRPSLRRSLAAKAAEHHRHCGRLPCTRHRGEYRDLLRRSGSPASVLALSESDSAGAPLRVRNLWRF